MKLIFTFVVFVFQNRLVQTQKKYIALGADANISPQADLNDEPSAEGATLFFRQNLNENLSA